MKISQVSWELKPAVWLLSPCHKWGYPKNAWFVRENPMKMDDFWVPPFTETPISEITPVLCVHFLPLNSAKQPLQHQSFLFCITHSVTLCSWQQFPIGVFRSLSQKLRPRPQSVRCTNTARTPPKRTATLFPAKQPRVGSAKGSI